MLSIRQTLYRTGFDSTVAKSLVDAANAGKDVLALVTVRGRGRTSGIEVETTMTGVWTIRDGKILRVVWFGSHDEALEAVGLSE